MRSASGGVGEQQREAKNDNLLMVELLICKAKSE